MSCEVAACLTLSMARRRRLLESSTLVELSSPNLVEVCDNAGDEDRDVDIVAPLLRAKNNAHCLVGMLFDGVEGRGFGEKGGGHGAWLGS